jgi:glycosyltransferase involved in cell wall biosynthesis
MILAQIAPAVVEKCVLIPPPANMCLASDVEQARCRGRRLLEIDEREFVVTYIGFLHGGKGLESLLRAFSLFCAERSDGRLILAGGAIDPESGNPVSYLESLHALAQSLGINDRIKWTGEYTWDSEDASLMLHASDVCVLPFRQGVHLNNSSFASVAAHGVPVVTTRGEFLEEQIEHGENVYLCAPDSPESLAKAMGALVVDPELRSRLRRGIAKLAQEWFSWEQALARTVEACGVASANRETSQVRNEELVQV